MILFLDIETAGFSVTKNAVCEIGAIAADYGMNVIDTFQCYIKPYTRADDTDELVSYKDDAMAIHGIPMETILNGENVDFVMQQLQMFVMNNGIKTIAGHNVKTFDIPRVEHLFTRFNPSYNLFGFPVIETLKLSREKWPQLPSHKLPDLCKHFGIDHKNAHSALGDCYANIELYKLLLK